MRIGRPVLAALVLLLAGGLAAPAAAQQEGERHTILVPNLAPMEGVHPRFGQNVARELRRLIDDLAFHQTVSDRDLRNARRQYNLDERQLYNCVTARQLAMQQRWQLVMCGEYTPAGDGQVRVEGSFVSAETGERFEVPPFLVSERDPRQTAQHLLESFDRWQTQLRHAFICRQYIDSQQWDAALRNCEDALAINARSETALYGLAWSLWKLDRRDEALGTLDRLLEINATHQDAMKLAGIVATEAGARDRARGYFDSYLELNPGDVNVRLSIATDIANAGDPETALRIAQVGLDAEPDNLNLLTYIGHFAANAAARAEQRGNAQAVDPMRITELYETAARNYQKVFEQRGTETEPQILERLIVALFKLQRYDEAVTLGARATQALPDNHLIWDAYARALEEAGKPVEALAAIERVEALGHLTAGLVQRKATLQLRQGQANQAIQSLQRGVSRELISPADAFRTVFAHAYQNQFQRGQLDAAYALLEAAAPLAVAEEDTLTRNFWRGYIVFQQAQRVAEPNNAASAGQAKPLFERALRLFQSSRGYERIHSSADVPRLIDAAQRFIEIQEALIRRGR